MQACLRRLGGKRTTHVQKKRLVFVITVHLTSPRRKRGFGVTKLNRLIAGVSLRNPGQPSQSLENRWSIAGISRPAAQLAGVSLEYRRHRLGGTDDY